MTDARRAFLLLVSLGLLAHAARPALAKKDKDGERGDEVEEDAGGEAIRDAVSKGDAEPLSGILAEISRQYPGEVVRIRLKGKDEDLHYRIRILQADGRRIEIHVDARNGRILEVDD